MIDRQEGFARMRILQWIALAIFLTLGLRVAYIQLIDSRYKEMARSNVMYRQVEYPPRGEIFDRNGNYIAQNRECYDLMVIYRDMDDNGFDTMRLCQIAGISPQRLRRKLNDARMAPRAPLLVTNYLSKEDKLRLDVEGFAGFHTISRTVRHYPTPIGGNLLGQVGLPSQRYLERHPEVEANDYVGTSGVEAAYESLLKGKKGIRILERDTHNALRGSYMDGALDTMPEAGSNLVCTIDAKLQLMGEELMAGKVGGAIAIEPSTGEILMMVSSPTFNPDQMVGRERSKHYNEVATNPRRPLYNRAVKGRYPPGSTFKLVQALIGLQEGVLHPSDMHPCHNGYKVGKLKMGCHAHRSPIDLRYAIATSCNAYFCYVFRDILENPKYGSVKEGFEVWKSYVESFGFGGPLGSDFTDESSGKLPTREGYDRTYRRSWNALTVLSLSIGQGEMLCSPLQLANLAATIANRGYYYTPHIVKQIEGVDSIDSRFRERHYTKVDPKHFETIIQGMWDGVNREGTSTAARLEGWDVCGKTGTAQNGKNRKDHSTFLSFAPRNNPKIAISVYVENGGFGASVALPIASLLEEYYLTDTIRRPELYKRMKELKLAHPDDHKKQ